MKTDIINEELRFILEDYLERCLIDEIEFRELGLSRDAWRYELMDEYPIFIAHRIIHGKESTEKLLKHYIDLDKENESIPIVPYQRTKMKIAGNNKPLSFSGRIRVKKD
jgi:hypothetical protein